MGLSVIACTRCGEQFNALRIDAQFCPECRILRARERAQTYDLHHKSVCQCGKEMVRGAQLCKACENRSRREKYQGENNPNWKSGRVDAKGYIAVRVKPRGPNPYRLEHRLVWEEAHGKPIPKGWVIHHLNGIKTDNRPENLVAMSRHYHHHHPREALRPYEARIAELEQFILRIGHDWPVGELPEVEEEHHGDT